MRWLVLLALAILVLGCTAPAPQGEKLKPYPGNQPVPKPAAPAVAPALAPVQPSAPAAVPQPSPAPQPSPVPDAPAQPPEELAPPASAEQCEKDSRYAENKADCYASLAGVLKDAFYCDKALDLARAGLPQDLPEDQRKQVLEAFGIGRAVCYAEVALALDNPAKCNTLGTELEPECRNEFYAQKAVQAKDLSQCDSVKPTRTNPTAVDGCRAFLIRFVLQDPSLCSQVKDAAQNSWCLYYGNVDKMMETMDRKPCYDIPPQPLPSKDGTAENYGRNLCLLQWMAAYGKNVYVCDEMKAQAKDFEACEQAYKALNP